MIKNLQPGTIVNIFDYSKTDQLKKPSDTIVLSLKEENGAILVAFYEQSGEQKELVFFSETDIDLSDTYVLELVLFKANSYRESQYYGFINRHKCYIIENSSNLKILNKEFPNNLKILAVNLDSAYAYVVVHNDLKDQYIGYILKNGTEISELGFAVSINADSNVSVRAEICKETKYVDF